MDIRWVSAFLDRPSGSLDATVRFWTAVTGCARSAWRGDHGEFATLLPPDGDAYLRVQRVRRGGGVHLDLHVGDLDAFVRHAREAGARAERAEDGLVVLRSPAGMRCCVVSHQGESVRPSPRRSAGGVPHLVDQVCVDVPGGGFDEECRFWAALTGWELRASAVRPEFRSLVRPPGLPLRLLLQRRDDDDGPARAHLDLASRHVDTLVQDHQQLGSTVLDAFEHWTALLDRPASRTA